MKDINPRSRINPDSFSGLPASSAALLRLSRHDSDRASMWVLCGCQGGNWEHAEGAILVIKGREETRVLHDWLVRQRMLTEHKPITGQSTHNPKKL